MATLSIEPNDRVTFAIRFEDEHMLVIEKRSGLVTNTGVGHQRDTLLNGLFARYGKTLQSLGEKRDFGLIHRLDRQTSGLLIVALTIPAHESLTNAIRQRQIAKRYWAMTRNKPKQQSGVIRIPLSERVNSLGKYTSERIARTDRKGKPALTAYRVLETSIHATLIEARPITGRLHQIRVHLDAIGCAVLGDPRYGPNESRQLAPRLGLHAHRLKFAHPHTDEPMDVRCAFPRDLRKTLSLLKLARPDLQPDPPREQTLEDFLASQQHPEELSGDQIGESQA